MKKCILILFCSFISNQIAAQALNAFILQMHGPGCDNQSGILFADAIGGNGNYTYSWSNGATTDTAFNLGAGTHYVTVYSGNDSVVKSVTLPPWGIDTVIIINACNGGLGSIFLDNISAQYPIQYNWYRNDTLLNLNNAFANNLSAGNYQYIITDAEGCVDSGLVSIVASTPVLYAYVSDSALCYGQSSQVWYTPGFTLYDNWGQTFNSSTDTITAQNYMSGISIPTYGTDSLGCFADLINNSPFVYLQSHPDPIPLYQIGDTISVFFTLNTSPISGYIYNWSYGLTPISSGPYSYLPIDSSGTYSVSVINEYGCSNFGNIQAVITNLRQNKTMQTLAVFPNPASENEPWNVLLSPSNSFDSYTLFDAQGKVVLSEGISSSNFVIPGNLLKGLYFLEMNKTVYRLIRN
jgi:hypothetical protein